VLDDYAFSALACLDAFEVTGDHTYFKFAKQIGDSMITKFFDATAGGFFDTEEAQTGSTSLGVLSARRKPFQDSPTPAGNSAAAILLVRLYHYTNDDANRERAEQNLEVFARMAEQAGLFAATYGIAAVHFTQPQQQVIVVGNNERAMQLYRVAGEEFSLNRCVLHLPTREATAQSLPPALAETLPNLPAGENIEAVAVVCEGFRCLPPIMDPATLAQYLRSSEAEKQG
jgi:uncharacterized protein YyaL (SSP411 family)